MKLDGEALFTALDVISQRAICEAKFPDWRAFVNQVNDAAGAQRPEPKGLRLDSDGVADFKRRCIRDYSYPTQVELLPASQCVYSSTVGFSAFSQLNSIVVENVFRGWLGTGCADFGVSEWFALLRSDEANDCFRRRLSKKEH